MKNNKFLRVSICIVFIIVIIGGFIIPEIYNKNNIREEYYDREVYHIKEGSNIYLTEEVYELVSSEDMYSKFLNEYSVTLEQDEIQKIKENDYDNNNYLLVLVPLNSCGENIIYDGVKIDDDAKYIIVEMQLEQNCGVCAPAYDLFEIKIPKNIDNYDIKLDWDIKEANCDPNIAYKPILYLYPEEKTEVKINFEKEEQLTTTYPKFKEEWNVSVYSNGDMYDKFNNYYYALYWEEKVYNKINFEEGFYVNKDNSIEFLEDKLSILGLNDRERNEFIMYWLPILENNEHSLVYFELTEELQKQNELIITPQPDTLIRIRMHVMKVDKNTKIKEQYLSTQDRIGFTAIEWGGVIYG